MRLLAAIVWALGAPALAQDFDAAVRELFGDDPARYRAVVEGFQAAVRDGDGAAAAAFVDYPIEVEVDGDERIVRDAADFAAHFEAIVTPEIAAAVADEPLADMMVNYQGVMLGQGEVWVSGVCADAACADPVVKVIAIQPVAEETAPGVGAVKAFHDWLVGCDNLLGCTALGLPPEDGSGGYVLVRLAAGAAAEPEVALVLVDPEGSGQVMRVAVEGKEPFEPLELPVEADGAWVRAAVPAVERAGLIGAMRDGDRLELGLGEAEPVEVSLRGATAAMLMIDDRQWRIGTVTALARPGEEPAASVAAAPEAQAVAALPIRAIDPAGVAGGGCGLGGCELRWGRGDGLRSRRRGDALGGLRLRGGLQSGLRFWVEGPEGLAPAVFDVPGRRDADPAVLTGPALGEDGLGIEAVDLGRGVGDCGEASRWAWTGEGFALVWLAGLDDCAGVAPGDWPVLWRADEGPARLDRGAAGFGDVGLAQAAGDGAGRPSPSGRPSIATTGVTKAEAAVTKASAASAASATLKARSSTRSSPAAARRRVAARVMPCRIEVDRLRVTSRPSAVTIQALLELASVTSPSSTIQASSAPALRAAIFAIEGARSCTVLMSRRPQRMSGRVTTRMPSRAAALSTSGRAWVKSTRLGVGDAGQAKSRSAAPRVTWR